MQHKITFHIVIILILLISLCLFNGSSHAQYLPQNLVETNKRIMSISGGAVEDDMSEYTSFSTEVRYQVFESQRTNQATQAETSNWSIVPSPTTEKLSDISMIPGSGGENGWIVGVNGTFLHWNGSEWIKEIGPSTTAVLAVAMASATDGWATDVTVIDGRYNRGFIYHWNGDQWVISRGEGAFIDALSVVPGSNGLSVYAAGWWGEIWHWNGTIWSIQNTTACFMLYDIDMLSDTDGWAVGGLQCTGDESGVILHWDGVSWQQVSGPDIGYYYHSVEAVASDNVWIVGGGGTILHWNGVAWSTVISPTTNRLYDISMVPGTNGMQGWVIGQAGTILYWNGSEFNNVSSPTSYDLNAIEVLSATDGWAVGSNGTILRYTFIGNKTFLPITLR